MFLEAVSLLTLRLYINLRFLSFWSSCVTLFIIYHVNVIVFKGYPGGLFLQACRPSTGYSSLVWEDSLDLCSVGFSRCGCCCIHSYICRTILKCGQYPCVTVGVMYFCLCWGDLLSLAGLSE